MTLPAVLVALETSGPVGSVGVAKDGRVLARSFLGEPREHAARVLPALARALAEAGLRTSDVGGVVVGAGPGSFTGVRVAAATGKGLAHALGIPLWAVSSLEAAAVTAEVLPAEVGPWPEEGRGRSAGADPGPGALRAVLFDARGRRLFVGAYQGSGARLRVVRPPAFSTLDAFLDDALLAHALLCGEAALRHRVELEAAGRRVLAPPSGVPSADALLARLVHSRPSPLEDPFGWEPDYLRQTGAERARGGEARRPG